MPASGRSKPRRGAFLVIEPSRVRKVTVERMEIEPKHLSRVVVIGFVDLHHADVFNDRLTAKYFAVSPDMAETRLTLRDFCHNGRILKVFAHIGLERKRLIREFLFPRNWRERASWSRSRNHLAVERSEKEEDASSKFNHSVIFDYRPRVGASRILLDLA